MPILNWAIVVWLLAGLVLYFIWFVRALMSFTATAAGPSKRAALRIAIGCVGFLGLAVLPPIMAIAVVDAGSIGSVIISLAAVLGYWLLAGLVCIGYFQLWGALARRSRRRHEGPA